MPRREFDPATVLIPYALDLERPRAKVRPDAADPARARDRMYCCPDCRGALKLHNGTKYVVHWAHLDPPEHCDLVPTGEGPEHFKAKMKVVRMIKSRKPIGLRRRCEGCGLRLDWWLPQGLVSAKPEVRLPNGLRADVGIFDAQGLPQLAFEVKLSHAVDALKRQALDTFQWVEVDAYSILQGPGPWDTTQENLGQLICDGCIEWRRTAPEREAAARAAAEERAAQARVAAAEAERRAAEAAARQAELRREAAARAVEEARRREREQSEAIEANLRVDGELHFRPQLPYTFEKFNEVRNSGGAVIAYHLTEMRHLHGKLLAEPSHAEPLEAAYEQALAYVAAGSADKALAALHEIGICCCEAVKELLAPPPTRAHQPWEKTKGVARGRGRSRSW